MTKNFLKPNHTTNIKLLWQSGLAILVLAVICAYGYSRYLKKKTVPVPADEETEISNFNYTPNAQWLALEPKLKARSIIVANLDTKEVYYSRHPDVLVNIASLSKLMTAMVTLDNLNLNKVLTVSSRAVNTYGNGDYLQIGEKLTVKDLLGDLLVFSSNDAAVALSEGVGYNRFIGLMNRKAKDIGLKETAFFDATGLDERGNFSNASDLLNMVNYVYQNYPLIGITSRLPKLSFKSINGVSHNVKNTDELINKISGLWLSKTGTTDNAGECLILVYRLNNGQTVASIILGSTDRISDSWIIFDQFKQAGLTI
ncbi:MAG TPA: serine hydrolase [Candidatus Paceibacterota bacterium]|nr:serine hydrolase [Candidatus Paceibacterota bacterium]